MSTVTCVVAVCDELQRAGLAALLGVQAHFEVVGSADTIDRTVGLCRRERPDVLVLDTRLRGAEGRSAVEILHACEPEIRILALVKDVGQRCNANGGGHFERQGSDPLPCCGALDCVGRAMADGAHAVLPHSADKPAFFRAARLVAADRPWFMSETVHNMAHCLLLRRRPRVTEGLSKREHQVGTLIARGLCNKEVGETLGIRIGTVKKHIGHILAKLRLRDRLQIGLFFSSGDPFEED